jgi:hypothetical protein
LRGASVTSPAFKSARMRAWSTWAISENVTALSFRSVTRFPDDYATAQLTKG